MSQTSTLKRKATEENVEGILHTKKAKIQDPLASIPESAKALDSNGPRQLRTAAERKRPQWMTAPEKVKPVRSAKRRTGRRTKKMTACLRAVPYAAATSILHPQATVVKRTTESAGPLTHAVSAAQADPPVEVHEVLPISTHAIDTLFVRPPASDAELEPSPDLPPRFRWKHIRACDPATDSRTISRLACDFSGRYTYTPYTDGTCEISGVWTSTGWKSLDGGRTNPPTAAIIVPHSYYL